MLFRFFAIPLIQIFLFLILISFASPAADAQGDPEIAVFEQQMAQLYGQGKYEDAAVVAKKAIAFAEGRYGRDNPVVGALLTTLAVAYEGQGRLKEAEQNYKRGLAIMKNGLGAEHVVLTAALSSLATLYLNTGRLADAEPLFKQALAIREKNVGSDHLEVAASLAGLGLLYKAQARLVEAERAFKRAIGIFEKQLGTEHPQVAIVLTSLASVYQDQGRFADAERLQKRSLAIAEKTAGPSSIEVAASLNGLAELYRMQARYAEAEPLLKRAITIMEKALGPNNGDVATLLHQLVALYQVWGRDESVEPLIKRSLAIREKTFGPDSLITGTSITQLATLSWRRGRYDEAETLYKRALTIAEKALGPYHPDVASALAQLAVVYEAQGRFAESEPVLKRSVAIFEKSQGPDHPNVATSLTFLAELYEMQGRPAEAEPLAKRGLAIREKALGPNHPDVALALRHLASVYGHLERTAEAQQLLKRALGIYEKTLGPDHLQVGELLNSLAVSYIADKRSAEAEPLLKRSLAILEKTHGREHDSVGVALNNIAGLYLTQGRDTEVEAPYRRAMAIFEKTLGPEHPLAAEAQNNLAELYLKRRDWVSAADLWRRGTGIVLTRARHGAQVGQSITGARRSEADRIGARFVGLVKALANQPMQAGPSAFERSSEMFQFAQRALGSDAAQSLAQMAARGAKNDPKLAAIVRERQDLAGEWQRRDAVRSAAVSQSPEQRDQKAEKENIARLDAIDVRIAEIDKRLSAQFPDYASLANPEPLSLKETQHQLHADEALVLFLDTDAKAEPLPEETYIWVVTKTETRWVRSDLGTAALAREVQALRCGLDAVAAAGARCVELAKRPATPDRLTFDLARAHLLYRALFGKVEDMLRGKHLLLVPSGGLTQLPFAVLVTAPPTDDDYRAASWLIRRHAMTVLPAVSSLKALRSTAHPSAASKLLVGFGNPLLAGPDSRYRDRAQRAKDNQRCAKPGMQTVALSAPRGSVVPLGTRGALADVSVILKQVPLPETADELCAVAQDLHADPADIQLGERATEHNIKAMSDSGQLAKYRMIHFATHGALAGELNDKAEPGLILTPPAKATALDDGYLSASEIAELKLDADWVILSACNTAAGDASSAQALSGLARAFFYAQARTLLVSHWAVDSDATVKLITFAVREIAQDTSVGRAEALRRAMLTLIDKDAAQRAHPTYWAPFILVGEGAD